MTKAEKQVQEQKKLLEEAKKKNEQLEKEAADTYKKMM